MCIFCFLKNYNQYHIRQGVQLRTDRFEHTLEKYKLYFIEGFNESLESDLCSSHKTQQNEKLFNLLRDISPREINTFFNSLREVYIEWIDSNPRSSLEKLENLIETYHIFDIYKLINGKILFRGRESKEFLSHWDMFHIPFNKRYLIGNQRYSLVGQPLLYLASSPYCVLKELDRTKNIKISSFKLSHLSYNYYFKQNIAKETGNPYCLEEIAPNSKWSDNNLKLFDNTDNLSNLITFNKPNTDLQSIDNIIIKDYTSEELKKYFFQFILSSCCSFKLNNAKRGETFCEEYVLPQVLAQVAKSKFDGIIFNSTQCYENEKLVEDSKLFNLLCRNYCIFTKYDFSHVTDVTYVYDRDLYNKFIISSPLDYEQHKVHINYLNINKSIELANEILNKEKYKELFPNLIDYFENLLLEITNYLINYRNILNNEELLKNLSEKDNLGENNLLYNSILLHSLSLRNIILNIRDFINHKEDCYEY